MSNEIKRYEFEGRALEFAPRSEGRVGAIKADLDATLLLADAIKTALYAEGRANA